MEYTSFNENWQNRGFYVPFEQTEEQTIYLWKYGAYDDSDGNKNAS